MKEVNKENGNGKKLSLILGTIAVVLLAAFIASQIDLKSKIGKLNEENAALAAAGAEKDGLITELRAAQETISAQVTSLEADKSGLEEKSAELEGIKSALQTEKDSLSEQVNTLDADNSALQETITGLESEKASLSEELTSVKGTLTSLETDKTTLTEQVVSLQESITGLESEKASLSEELTSVKGSLTSLETDKTTLTEQAAALQETVTGLEADKTALTEQTAALQETVTGLEADKTTLSEQVAALQETVAGLEADKTTLSEQLTASEGTVTNLETDKATLSEQIKALESEKDVLSEQVTSLEGEKDALSQQIDELNAALNPVKEEAEDPKSGLQDQDMPVETDSKEEPSSDAESGTAAIESIQEPLGPTDIKISFAMKDSDDAAGDLFAGSDIVIKTDPEKKAYEVIVRLMGLEFMDLTLDKDENSTGFYLPVLDENYYRIDNSLLFSSDKADTTDIFEASGAVIDTQKYLGIVMKHFSIEDFTETEESLDLTMFGETVDCTMLKFEPTDEQIRGFLTDLLTELNRDPQIDLLVATQAKFSDEGKAAEDPEAYAQEKVDEFHRSLENTLGDMDPVVSKFSGMLLSIASVDDRIREVYLGPVFGYGFLYQNSGEPEEARGDAFAVYNFEKSDSIIFFNQFNNAAGAVNGEFDILSGEEYALQTKYSFDAEVKSELFIPYGKYLVWIGEDPFAIMSVYEVENGSMHEIEFDSFTLFVESQKGNGVVLPNLTPIEIHTQEEFDKIFNQFSENTSEIMGLLGI